MKLRSSVLFTGFGVPESLRWHDGALWFCDLVRGGWVYRVAPAGEPERIVAVTGETTYLSIAGPSETAIYIAMVEGTHAVRHTSWVGQSMPFANLAVGRRKFSSY